MSALKCFAAQHVPPVGQTRQKLQQQKQQQSSAAVPPATALPQPAYSVAPARKIHPNSTSVKLLADEEIQTDGEAVRPVQQHQLDHPLQWPELSLEQPSVNPHVMADRTTDETQRPNMQPRNPFGLPASWHRTHAGRAAGPQAPAGLRTWAEHSQPETRQGHCRVAHGCVVQGLQQAGRRHPPFAPEEPEELLKVLQVMDPPRRRIVMFKGGGYIYSDMEALIESAGLGHVMRLTNLMRKAHCVVAKERRDTGKKVNLNEHIAAARNANIPFLLIDRLEAQNLVGLLRPLLIRKRIVVERPQKIPQQRAEAQSLQGNGLDEGLV